MSEKMTDKSIKEALGDAAASFSDKGIAFLRLRSNGAQGAIAQKMLQALNKGTLKIPVKLNEEVSTEFGYSKMTPPMLAITVLGRPPVRARTGGIQESGKVHNPKQLVAATQIATAVKADLYKNYQRKPAATKVEKPATPAETPKVAKPVVAKTPAKKTAPKKRRAAKKPVVKATQPVKPAKTGTDTK